MVNLWFSGILIERVLHNLVFHGTIHPFCPFLSGQGTAHKTAPSKWEASPISVDSFEVRCGPVDLRFHLGRPPACQLAADSAAAWRHVFVFLLRSLRLKEARLTTFGFVSFGVSKEGDPAKAGFVDVCYAKLKRVTLPHPEFPPPPPQKGGHAGMHLDTMPRKCSLQICPDLPLSYHGRAPLEVKDDSGRSSDLGPCEKIASQHQRCQSPATLAVRMRIDALPFGSGALSTHFPLHCAIVPWAARRLINWPLKRVGRAWPEA